MICVDFNQKFNKPIILALGFFDCIHLGHKKLVERAIQLANSEGNDTQSSLFTFSNDPNVYFDKSPQIYNFENRASVLERLGVDVVVSSNFDSDFANMSPQNFLDRLTSNFCIKSIVVGNDYTFGKNAQGDVDFLCEYCKCNGILLEIVPFATVDGQKISTRLLKQYVLSGDIKSLNALLCENYFVQGEVIHERHEGTQLGFPTANLRLANDMLKIGDGIYATTVFVEGECYNAMTNVGAKPTFEINSTSIETYIFDFDKDIYGKKIKVSFVDRIRDVCKFTSIDALKTQLVQDEKRIRQIFDDMVKI